MYLDGPGPRLVFPGGSQRLGIGSLHHFEVRAGAADESDLGRAGEFGDKNLRWITQRMSHVGDRRAMVAARGRDDATGRHLPRQKRVERPAHLERPGQLSVLEFHLDRRRQPEIAGQHDRCPVEMVADALAGHIDFRRVDHLASGIGQIGTFLPCNCL